MQPIMETLDSLQEFCACVKTCHGAQMFYKLTVHFDGANKSSVFKEITKCLKCQHSSASFL